MDTPIWGSAIDGNPHLVPHFSRWHLMTSGSLCFERRSFQKPWHLRSIRPWHSGFKTWPPVTAVHKKRWSIFGKQRETMAGSFLLVHMLYVRFKSQNFWTKASWEVGVPSDHVYGLDQGPQKLVHYRSTGPQEVVTMFKVIRIINCSCGLFVFISLEDLLPT